MATIPRKLVGREFTPAEAAKISGVSTVLQRDWRRRGLLPAKDQEGWAKFTVVDVIEMAVMKAMSDSGFSVQAAMMFAIASTLPTIAALELIPGVVVVEGNATLEKRERILSNYDGGAARYLLAPLSRTDTAPEIEHTSDLRLIPELLEKSGAFHALVIDHAALARMIADRAGLPLFRINAEVDDESLGPPVRARQG